MAVFGSQSKTNVLGAPPSSLHDHSDITNPLLTTQNPDKHQSSGAVESMKNDLVLQGIHDAVEQELIQTVSRWSHRVIVFLPGAAAFMLYQDGQDIYINPLICSVVAIVAGFFSLHTQWIMCFGVLTAMIVKHSLAQGCSASLVPAIYGFIPCAFGFLFRTTRVVVMSTIMVLAATFLIVSFDLLDMCTSEPIQATQKEQIVADRLLPLSVLILGNSITIIAIVKQSQKSVLLHAKAAQSAAKLADVRRDVLHRVTHELRTPLNGIVGSVELLTTSDTMNEHDMENALTIKSSLQNIVRICDDVLMAAKSKTDDRIRKETVFSLASCVDDVADIFAAAASAKGISLKVEYVGDIQVMVRGMEVELRQVLLNLVGNAMKFTDYGSITIRVQEQESQLHDVVRYRFEVEDTGIGLEAESSNMLFEAFEQGEQNVVSRQHKGTGLGLTICKDFVELMGGNIIVDGSRGKGSRFHFCLDLKREEWAVPGEKHRVDGSRLQIVIADSEPESVATCRSVVASVAPGSHVETVSSVSALLDFIATAATDDSGGLRVALVDCCPLDTPEFASTVSRIRDAGWLVLAYSDHEGFSRLIDNSKDAYAVFRRPIPIIRMGDTFRDAVNGVAPPIRQPATTFIATQTDNAGVVISSVQETPFEKPDTRTNKVDGKDPKAQEADTGASPLSSTKAVKPVSNKRPSRARAKVELRPGSKVVVVDDTPVNVKVLTKMLSRSTTVPIVSCFDGQSAVELVSSSNQQDLILFLMDWHMPGVCGLTATDSIRRIAKDRGGPSVYICMVTADIEGLHSELNRRSCRFEGTVSKGELIMEGERSDGTSTESDNEVAIAKRLSQQVKDKESGDGFTVVDIVAEKPVTFSSINSILTWFQKQVEKTANDSSLSERYFKRLHLSRTELELMSPLERLQAICAAHLEYIPFENLSQHGVGDSVSLNSKELADKLLDRRRGGFCFELNGLLAELLLELGYNLVRVIAHVYVGDDFMEQASHMFLMVTLQDQDENDQKYLVDVGFAEPAIHPLRYELDTVQKTPEGMVSRLVRNGNDIVLEWLDIQSETFVPRYKFKETDGVATLPGPPLTDFHENLMTVYHPESAFAQKLIVCCVNHTKKTTVSGNKLKVTGPPRFDKNAVPVVRELGHTETVRKVLEDEFGIPYKQTEGLDLTLSLQSPPKIWS